MLALPGGGQQTAVPSSQETAPRSHPSTGHWVCLMPDGRGHSPSHPPTLVTATLLWRPTHNNLNISSNTYQSITPSSHQHAPLPRTRPEVQQ
eukprot:scaffold269089_cov30-Tisochrysis_lutea.AAC.1